ncbi:MAG: hypothetical protein LBP59_18840 [Planctomycetaceae bacterium]|nr:hypothetical protein [Planctomycetaceae bacterium]
MYDYDTKGNLISATDQLGNTTKFNYLDTPNAPEYYLDTIIDSFNRTNEFYQIRQPLKNHSILQTHNIKI